MENNHFFGNLSVNKILLQPRNRLHSTLPNRSSWRWKSDLINFIFCNTNDEIENIKYEIENVNPEIEHVN